MFESFTLEAPGASLTVGMEDAAVRVTAQEWPSPKMTPHVAAGADGPVRIHTAADRGERTVSLTVDCGGGNVTGGGDGRAVNRVGGRAVESTVAASTIDWPVYTGDGVPGYVEAGASVRLSSPGVVRVEVRRGSSVVAFRDVQVQADRTAHVRVPRAATTGSGGLVLRVSAPTHVAGATLEATLPFCGDGLDGVYHDADMPGCTLLDAATGASTRPAGGEEWARAFLSGLATLNGAVGSRPGTLTATNRAGDSYTFELAAVDPEHELLPEFYGGQTSVKLALQCSAYAEGPQVTLPGTLSVNDGLSVWTGSAPVAGEVPALLDVAGTFSEPRQWMTVSASDAAPTVIRGTALTVRAGTSIAVVTSGAGAGNGTVRRIDDLSDSTDPLPTLSFTAAATGRYRVAVHWKTEAVFGAGAAVALMVGDRVVARKALDGVSGWMTLAFGEHDLTAGETVYLAQRRLETFSVDWVSLEQAGGTSAAVEARAPNPPLLTAGDVASTSTVAFGSSIHGTAGRSGGTWSASGWTRVDADVPTGRPIGFLPAAGAAATIGEVARPWRQVVQIWVNATGVAVDVAGLYTVALGGTGPSGVSWTITTEAFASGVVSTVRTRPGSTGTVTYSSSVPAMWASAASVPLTFSGISGTNVVVTSLELYQLTSYPTTVNWHGRGTGELVVGALPTVAPGVTPRLALVAGATDPAESPKVAGPTSVVVKATPRFLSVPGG